MLTIENLYILVAALALVCVILAAFLISSNLQKTKQREALENLQDELKDSERLNIEQRAKLEANNDKINELAKNLDEYKISLKQKDEKEDELERELRRLNEELGSQTKMAEMAKSLSLNLQNELGAKEDELKRSSESENELKRAIVALKSEIEAKENILRSQEENLNKAKSELNLKEINLKKSYELENELRCEIISLKSKVETKEKSLILQEENLNKVQNELDFKDDEFKKSHKRVNELECELVALKSEIEAKENILRSQEENLKKVKNELNLEFANLANKIFEEKSANFSKNSKESLELLLTPLGEKIISFEKRVNDAHSDSQKSAGELSAQLKEVVELGKNMSKEANSLSTALKGSNKVLGNWGEMQLERTLEAAGLEKGTHYVTQESFDVSGKKLIPDFVINFPDDKQMIIDSKVSLHAYEKAVAAADPAQSKLALGEHIASIKKHIDELAKKDYSSLVKSPDFVLMFVPVEPAFLEALKFDPNLFNYGYEKKVVLVSHTTLMPLLRVVANLWRMENGNKEAKEILKSANEIYEKFCTVAEKLNRLGNSVRSVNDNFNEVVKSVSGQGGLDSRLEKFKKIAINPKDTQIKELEARPREILLAGSKE
ncbi:DNA recombination protein RmuC [Campylobacter concisus]|uniref:DNA recombination protein RmuC n=1 Tax=Campylobacter concisus TaxID=199 RepID=UPI001CB80467|nr:DNA recombination protein RmuC [Campylobacter concisus]